MAFGAFVFCSRNHLQHAPMFQVWPLSGADSTWGPRHVRPRVGGAAELEVLAACERTGRWGTARGT